MKSKRDYSVLVKKRVGSQAKVSRNKFVRVLARIYFMMLHFLKYPADILKVSLPYLLK